MSAEAQTVFNLLVAISQMCLWICVWWLIYKRRE